MESYSNLVEGINDLKKQGYTVDFNVNKDCIVCRDGQHQLLHNEFEIDKWFRIEGDDSSAESSSILYAISSDKFNIKGVLVNAYGMYSSDIADEMLSKLKFA